jgi:hypothetical protein
LLDESRERLAKFRQNTDLDSKAERTVEDIEGALRKASKTGGKDAKAMALLKDWTEGRGRFSGLLSLLYMADIAAKALNDNASPQPTALPELPRFKN